MTKNSRATKLVETDFCHFFMSLCYELSEQLCYFVAENEVIVVSRLDFGGGGGGERVAEKCCSFVSWLCW